MGRRALILRVAGLALLLAGCMSATDRQAWDLWARGAALGEERRWEESAAVLRAAAALRPDSAGIQRSLALALHGAGHEAEALAAYRAAARLRPEIPEVHVNLAALLAATGQRDEALAELDTAIRLQPQDAALRLRRALLLRDLGRLDEALAAVDRALGLAPESAEAHAQRGLLLYRKGRREEAHRALAHALALDPRAHVAAAAIGEIETVEHLVAEGAAVDAPDPAGLTALMAAAAAGHAGTVERLLALGASPGARGPGGWTPLTYAAWRGRTAVARVLVVRGAELEARTATGSTPLLVAAFWGQSDMVRALLQFGADPNARDGRGQSAVGLAGRAGYRDVVEALRAAGARDTIDLSAGKALALGRLAVTVEGVIQEPYRLERPTVRLLHVERGKVRTERIDEDGGVAWRLPRGTYVVLRLRYRGDHVPRLLFQVPYGADVLYLGTVRVDVARPAALGPGLTPARSTTVADEFDAARADLLRHAGGSATVAHGLAVHDPALPLDPEAERAALSRRLERLGLRLVRTAS